jgi:hypothetical protein
MTELRDESAPHHDDGEGWTSEDQLQLMARYEQLVQEAAMAPETDGQSVVATFDLGGSVPRQEGNHSPFRSKDVYIRLESTIYGPVTQDELGEMLASGELTGYESASADLQHWTPLIYHPRMTLTGEIDPDATHDLLHNRSTLPMASRSSGRVDLEAIADGDEPEMPSTPLAAILIKPIRVSRRTGLPLPVHADLSRESMEEVIERTPITEEQRRAGQEAAEAFAREAGAEALAQATDETRDWDVADTAPTGHEPIVPGSAETEAPEPADPESTGLATEAAEARPDARRWTADVIVGWLVAALLLTSAVLAATALLERSGAAPEARQAAEPN